MEKTENKSSKYAKPIILCMLIVCACASVRVAGILRLTLHLPCYAAVDMSIIWNGTWSLLCFFCVSISFTRRTWPWIFSESFIEDYNLMRHTSIFWIQRERHYRNKYSESWAAPIILFASYRNTMYEICMHA